MSATEPEAVNRFGSPLLRRLGIYAIVLVVGFLLGLVPMWLSARARASERDAAQKELRLCRLEKSLLSAAVESRRGEYERARLAASNFFSALREQVDLAGERSDLTAAQKESLKPLLNQRDDLITLLARSDPAAADRLAEMYMSFSKSAGSTMRQ
jgi:hypothetical protein